MESTQTWNQILRQKAVQEWPAAWSRRRATLLSTPPLRSTATLRGFFSGNEHDKQQGSIAVAAAEVEQSGLRVEKRDRSLREGRERRRRRAGAARGRLRRRGLCGKQREKVDAISVVLDSIVARKSLINESPLQSSKRILKIYKNAPVPAAKEKNWAAEKYVTQRRDVFFLFVD